MIVYKYPIGKDFEQEVELPESATILDVEFQGDNPFLWALVDPERPKEKRKLLFSGTGWTIKHHPRLLMHLKTIHHGGFVWHIFEII